MKKKNYSVKTFLFCGAIIYLFCFLMGVLLIFEHEIVNGVCLILGGVMILCLLSGFATIIQLLQDIKDNTSGNSAPVDPEEIPEI